MLEFADLREAYHTFSRKLRMHDIRLALSEIRSETHAAFVKLKI